MRYINVRYLLTYLLTSCLIRAGERRNRNDVPLFFERLNAVAALVADTAVLFLRAFVKKCCRQVRFSSSIYTKILGQLTAPPDPLAGLQGPLRGKRQGGVEGKRMRGKEGKGMDGSLGSGAYTPLF